LFSWNNGYKPQTSSRGFGLQLKRAKKTLARKSLFGMSGWGDAGTARVFSRPTDFPGAGGLLRDIVLTATVATAKSDFAVFKRPDMGEREFAEAGSLLCSAQFEPSIRQALKPKKRAD